MQRGRTLLCAGIVNFALTQLACGAELGNCIDPDDTNISKSIIIESCNEFLSKGDSLSTEAQARAYDIMARVYFIGIDFEEAQYDITKAIKLDESKGKYYADRGRITYSEFVQKYVRGDASAYNQQRPYIIVDLLKARDLGFADPTINTFLGDLYSEIGQEKQKIGQVEMAIAYFGKAIEVDSGKPLNYKLRGQARSAIGDKTGAKQDFEKMLSLGGQ